MPGCAENVVNTMVFIRCPVLRKLEVWVPRGRVRVSFGRVSGDPGVTFSRFRGCRKAIGYRMDFHGFPGWSQILRPARWKVTLLVQGGTQQPDCKLQGYKTTKLHDYMITGLERTGTCKLTRLEGITRQLDVK